jgi:hypothetical protein
MYELVKHNPCNINKSCSLLSPICVQTPSKVNKMRLYWLFIDKRSVEGFASAVVWAGAQP